MYSQERRCELYQLLFIWKISQKQVEGHDMTFNINPRRGRLAEVHYPSIEAPPSVRRAKEGSLFVKGAKIFKFLPQPIQNIDSTEIETFKMALDSFISCVPDQPTIPGQPRAASTNSLMDQLPLMEYK